MGRRSFWKLIRSLAGQGTTVFVTTHYLDEAEYCDRLALIQGGRLVASGTPAAMKASFPHPILEVTGRPLLAALTSLQSDTTLGDVSIWGSSLHVVLPGGGSTRSAVLERLAAAGITVDRDAWVPATLEDVFVLKGRP